MSRTGKLVYAYDVIILLMTLKLISPNIKFFFVVVVSDCMIFLMLLIAKKCEDCLYT